MNFWRPEDRPRQEAFFEALEQRLLAAREGRWEDLRRLLGQAAAPPAPAPDVIAPDETDASRPGATLPSAEDIDSAGSGSEPGVSVGATRETKPGSIEPVSETAGAEPAAGAPQALREEPAEQPPEAEVAAEAPAIPPSGGEPVAEPLPTAEEETLSELPPPAAEETVVAETDIPADLVEPPIAAPPEPPEKPLKEAFAPPPPADSEPPIAAIIPMPPAAESESPPRPATSQAKPPARRVDWRSQPTASLLKSLPWKGSSGDFSAPEFFGETTMPAPARRSALAPKTRSAPSPSRTGLSRPDPNTPVTVYLAALPWQGPTENLGSSHLDEDGEEILSLSFSTSARDDQQDWREAQGHIENPLLLGLASAARTAREFAAEEKASEEDTPSGTPLSPAQAFLASLPWK